MFDNGQIEALIQHAIEASKMAYAPYSKYNVGAALMAADGTVYRGCNIENAAYPASICAERTALVKAVSEGHHSFSHIVVVTRDGGSPCGHCRQMLFEFAPDLDVIIANMQGEIVHRHPLRELLLHGFGPEHFDT